MFGYKGHFRDYAKPDNVPVEVKNATLFNNRDSKFHKGHLIKRKSMKYFKWSRVYK